MTRIYVNSNNYIIFADNTDTSIDTRMPSDNVYLEKNATLLIFYKKTDDSIIKSIDFSDVLDENGVAYSSIEFFVNLIENTEIKTVTDFYTEVQKGNVAGHSIVHKFGANENLNSSWSVVSSNGLYQTPTIAQSLEVLSDNANDTFLGTGARTVTFEGLDASFNAQSETVEMNGTTAVSLVNTYLRIFRVYVLTSGTYADITAGSHTGVITLQGVGGGVSWAEIGLIDGFPSGQSQIAAFTIPTGKTGYILSKDATLESSKPVDLTLFKRENADDITAPYSGVMRVTEHNHGLTLEHSFRPKSPLGALPEKTDVGFLAKVGTSGTVSIDFEILLVDN